jgi:hypothetical protein
LLDIAHGQALGGLIDLDAIKYLTQEENLKEILKDSAQICLLLDTLSLVAKQSDKLFSQERQLLKTKLLEKKLEDGRGIHWDQGTALSSEVETTAYHINVLKLSLHYRYALVALSRTVDANYELLQLLSKGIQFLMNTRTSSGWYTTSDTLWASFAASEISKLLPPQPPYDAILTVSLNNILVREIPFTSENLYYKVFDLRKIHVDKLKQGQNDLAIQLSGTGSSTSNIAVEVKKWYPQRTSNSNVFNISREIHQKGNQVNILYEVVPFANSLGTNIFCIRD